MLNDKLTAAIINLDVPPADFLQEMKATLKEGYMLNLPLHETTERITIHNPEPGLEMRAWHISFKSPVSLLKSRIQNTTIREMSLFIIMTPESCFLKKVGEHTQFTRQSQPTILLVSDDINLYFEVQPYLPFKLIDIKISSSWIKEQLENNSMHFSGKWKEILDTAGPVIIHELYTDNSLVFNVTRLFSLLLSVKAEASQTGSLIIALISEFLDKASSRPVINQQDELPEILKDVIGILKSHLHQQLPRLSTIARQVALSESTLKRHFKEVFGKSIYGYYLDMKMELAHHLLVEKKSTVNQAAQSLGYENVSNFIDMFKKKYGTSPGSVKKKL